MWFYLIRGGPILVVIGILSVIGGALVFIQWHRIRQAERSHGKPLEELGRRFRKRDWFEARRILDQDGHPFLAPWRTCLPLLIEGNLEFQDIQESVSVEGNRLIAELESALVPLGTITMILPMVGFLGTVVGLIGSFRQWELIGTHVSLSALAGGIYQAMITTAAGLMTAIPLYVLHHLLVARTQRVALNFSSETTQLFRWIKEGLVTEASPESEPALSSQS